MKINPKFCRGLSLVIAALTSAAVAMPVVSGRDLYDRAAMKEMDLNGLRVWLGKPVPVTSQIGWGTERVQPDLHPSTYRDLATWSFVHLTPYMAKFPGGNLIATYAMDPDTQDNPFFLTAFQISTDGGFRWGRRYTTLMQHIPMIYIPQDHDSLMAIPSEVMWRTEREDRNFIGPSYLFKNGGSEMVMVLDGFRLVDWPWLPHPKHKGTPTQPRGNWHVPGLSITGSVMKIGNKWVASCYGRKGDASVDSCMLIASDDGCKTWRYYSTIADGDRGHTGEKSFEGANEPSFIRLADGDLMAVFRTGENRGWHVHRAYSHDEGLTWTKPDSLPAWSVEPQVMRTSNGIIALSTGRPGIYLWLSTDPRANSWQNIDLVAYHNSVTKDPNAHINRFEHEPSPRRASTEGWQTTGYTAMVETAPNRILLIYDRDSERKPVDTNDISRVYVLPVEIERN